MFRADEIVCVNVDEESFALRIPAAIVADDDGVLEGPIAESVAIVGGNFPAGVVAEQQDSLGWIDRFWVTMRGSLLRQWSALWLS